MNDDETTVTNQATDRTDPWKLKTWHALPRVCFVYGCEADSGIDERGPVWLNDGTMHRACVDHWVGIMRVLGEQEIWQTTDAAHWVADEEQS